MGRKRKQGFSYFPLDIDFFSDIRIRKLIKNNGSQAVSIYLCVLTFIYENGYYVVNDRDLGFVISERTGCKESMVSAVLSYCVSIGLFDETMYKQGVFTSKSVQERYFLMCKSAKRTIVFSEYSLISSEKMRISSEEIAINSEKSTQSKVKNNYMHNYSDINNICENEILKISSEEITINSKEKKEKISPQPPKKRKSFLPQEELGEFASVWYDWLEYKQTLRKSYKSEKSERIGFRQLVALADNSPEIARKIAEQSIANTWTGLFELKRNFQSKNEPINKLANEPVSQSTNEEPRIGRTSISEIKRGLTGWE